MTGIRFRASACGNYVVSLIGESVRVLPVDEAADVAQVYRANQAQFAAAGRLIMATHEEQAAAAIEGAVAEARHTLDQVRAAVLRRRG